MKYLLMAVFMAALAGPSSAQELFVQTEPASNMPARSFGLRSTNRIMRMDAEGNYRYRTSAEWMVGLDKKWMAHASVYISDMLRDFHFEGGSVYLKYRFLSLDDVHAHFRMSAFGRISWVDNPSHISVTKTRPVNGVLLPTHVEIESDEIDLEGTNSGYSGGLIVTQLLHKLALSGSVAYLRRWTNWNGARPRDAAEANLHTSFSAGYLLLPRRYRNYEQPNLNLYLELLHGEAFKGRGFFVDAAPSVQLILKSVSRLDFSYRWQIAGDMPRFSESGFLIRFEHNILR